MAAPAPYGLREVARLSGASEAQLRRWARNGLLPGQIGPDGSVGYRFADVIAARAACALIDQGAPVRAVRQAVDALRAWRPEVAHPLAALKVQVEAGRVLVRLEQGLMESQTGQLLLALSAEGAAETGDAPAPAATAAVVHRLGVATPVDADGWLQWAEDGRASGVDPAVIRSRYGEALALDPEHPGALIGLGNLAHEAGDLESARTWYARATHAAPAHPHPWYNLANTLDDLGAVDAAAQAYETALALDPEHVDAHFNLALLWEKVGIRARALAHWQRVLALSADTEARSLALRFAEDETDR